MHESLVRTLEAFSTRLPSESWIQAASSIRAERDLIDSCLSQNPDIAVYGFTTRLGEEDSQQTSPEEQRDLLIGHLVGPGQVSSADWRTLLLATKLEQAHHGGSGIHPYTYECLLEAMTLEGSILGNWLNSYSCGDVVAGAWLAHDIMNHYPDLLAHRGALITIINGHFVSTSMAMVAVASLVDATASLLSAWLPFTSGNALQEYGLQWVDRAGDASITRQLPVSLRDPRPVMQAIHSSLSALGRSLEDRLAEPSCNPKFLVSGSAITSVSQSSFLDYRLTFALTTAIQLSSLVAGIWQRLIQHRCASVDSIERRIQSPKSAQGLTERIRMSAIAPTAFSGFDSEGIEDLRDLSLINGHALARLSRLVAQYAQIWTGMGMQIPTDRTKEIRAALVTWILESESISRDRVNLWFDRLLSLQTNGE